MPQEFWRSLQDLALIFSARPIAIPLIFLLIIKLYSLNSSALVYALGLFCLTVLFSMRWCIHLIATNKNAFLTIYREQREKD